MQKTRSIHTVCINNKNSVLYYLGIKYDWGVKIWFENKISGNDHISSLVSEFE